MASPMSPPTATLLGPPPADGSADERAGSPRSVVASPSIEPSCPSDEDEGTSERLLVHSPLAHEASDAEQQEESRTAAASPSLEHGRDRPTRTATPPHTAAAVAPAPASTTVPPTATAAATTAAAAAAPTSGALQSREETHFIDTHGKDPGTPRVLLLRHRMGISTVALTHHQRKDYTRSDLEDFLLYKEQKYNAVNVLGRFCVFLLLVTSFSVFCLIFSLCSTDWLVVRYLDFYKGIGMFTSCIERVLRQCTKRTSSDFSRTVYDSITGDVVCTVTSSYARRYIAAMWTMTILHLAAQICMLALSVYMSCRPTRSRTLLWITYLSALCMILGIINCVLFNFYVRCDRKGCAAQHLSIGPHCQRSWQWGYRLYIAAVATHALCFMTAFSMRSYIMGIRVRARQQLDQQRRQRQVQRAAVNFAQEAADGFACSPVDNAEDSTRWSRSQTVPRGPPANSAEASPNGSFTRRYVLITDEADLSTSRRRPTLKGWRDKKGCLLSQTQSLVVPPSPSALNGPGDSLHQSLAGTQRVVNLSCTMGSLNASYSAPPLQQQQQQRSSREMVEFRYRRRQNKSSGMQQVLDRDYDPTYLTAEELGVHIAGAADWVYDDKSDMFYSFERNMFWDSLTGEYYNCELSSWQESPTSIVEVRDAMKVAWNDAYMDVNNVDAMVGRRTNGNEETPNVNGAP